MNLFDFVLVCCKGLVRLFKNIGCFLLKTIRLGLQYFWIVFVCASLGLFLGWLSGRPFATVYNGNATITYAEGMRDVVQEGIVDFLNLPEEKKIEYGLTQEVWDAFYRLNVYNVVDCNADTVADFIDRNRKIDLADTMNVVMRDRIHLEVKLFGKADFKPYEEALNNFFNSQDYLVEAHERCKMIQEERLAYFTKEVARLDSFSTYDYFIRPRSLVMEEKKGFIIGSKQNLYYDAVIVVLDHKSHLLKQKMETPNVINFQTPFVVYAMPPVYKYALGLFFGGVVGLLIALALKYKAEILAYLKEK